MIDLERITSILAQSHTYYMKDTVPYEHVGPLVPTTADLLAQALVGDVLDVGCGRGDTLVRNAAWFGRGVGMDNDAGHLDRARQRIARGGVRNVRLVRGLAFQLPFADATFDVVFSERGPLGHNDPNHAQALRVLKPGGRLFYETIGEWNHLEVRTAFEPEYERPASSLRVLRAEEDRLLRFGVRVEVLASRLEVLRFPDLYEWLRYQCTVWTYTGTPLPPAEDIGRFERFAASTSDAQGRIHTTPSGPAGSSRRRSAAVIRTTRPRAQPLSWRRLRRDAAQPRSPLDFLEGMRKRGARGARSRLVMFDPYPAARQLPQPIGWVLITKLSK